MVVTKIKHRMLEFISLVMNLANFHLPLMIINIGLLSWKHIVQWPVFVCWRVGRGEEVDVILQRSEGGVDSALLYAKTIAKYMKDLINYVEKRISLGQYQTQMMSGLNLIKLRLIYGNAMFWFMTWSWPLATFKCCLSFLYWFTGIT